MKPNPRFDAIVRRLSDHVASVRRKYPDVWKQVEQFRQMKGSKEIGDWPNWCFMPLAGAYAIVTGGRDDVPVTGCDVGVIGALGAWRMTKGIYDFDATIFEELWSTPVEGEIPAEVLESIPEWCCYVPFPEPRQILSDIPDCVGFFVHLECDQSDGRMELRFLLDYGQNQLMSLPLHVIGNLTDSFNAALDETIRQSKIYGMIDGQDPDRVRHAVAVLRRQIKSIAPLVSLTLYLCSTTAEIVGRDANLKPACRPRVAFTKRGRREFAAEQPQMWEVGYRIGATLRAAALRASGPDRGGSHAGPRPHVRRAHWHAFWTGPKASSTQRKDSAERKLVLRWLHPILVNMEEGAPIPTVHPVKK